MQAGSTVQPIFALTIAQRAFLVQHHRQPVVDGGEFRQRRAGHNDEVRTIRFQTVETGHAQHRLIRKLSLIHIFVYIAVAVGFAEATINPFTIGIAQEVSQVPLCSGLGYRIFCFVIFMGISIIYVWRYAEKVRKHPEKSILAGENLNFREVGTKEELMTVSYTHLIHLAFHFFLVIE